MGILLTFGAFLLRILLFNFLVIYVALSLLRRYEGIYHLMIFIGTCMILFYI